MAIDHGSTDITLTSKTQAIEIDIVVNPGGTPMVRIFPATIESDGDAIYRITKLESISVSFTELLARDPKLYRIYLAIQKVCDELINEALNPPPLPESQPEAASQ
jgi:hypothetical protein